MKNEHGAPDLTDLTRPTRHDPTEPQISDTGQPRFFTGKNEGPKRPQASIRAANWPNLVPIMRLSARNAQKHSNKKIQKIAGVLSFKTEEIWMDSRMDAWTWKIHLESPQASIRAASWPNLAPIMRLSARNAQKHSNKKIQKFASVLSFKTEEIWMDSRMSSWTWKIHVEIQT